MLAIERLGRPVTAADAHSRTLPRLTSISAHFHMPIARLLASIASTMFSRQHAVPPRAGQRMAEEKGAEMIDFMLTAKPSLLHSGSRVRAKRRPADATMPIDDYDRFSMIFIISSPSISPAHDAYMQMYADASQMPRVSGNFPAPPAESREIYARALGAADDYARPAFRELPHAEIEMLAAECTLRLPQSGWLMPAVR